MWPVARCPLSPGRPEGHTLSSGRGQRVWPRPRTGSSGFTTWLPAPEAGAGGRHGGCSPAGSPGAPRLRRRGCSRQPRRGRDAGSDVTSPQPLPAAGLILGPLQDLEVDSAPWLGVSGHPASTSGPVSWAELGSRTLGAQAASLEPLVSTAGTSVCPPCPAPGTHEPAGLPRPGSLHRTVQLAYPLPSSPCPSQARDHV